MLKKLKRLIALNSVSDDKQPWLDWEKQANAFKTSNLIPAVNFFSTFSHTFQLTALPSTLKLRQDQFPALDMVLPEIRLDAARGEGESIQLLVSAGQQPLRQLSLTATALQDRDGNAIAVKIFRLGYVPVKNIDTVSFQERGSYPDPLCPNSPFDLSPFTNQSLLLTVQIPPTAKPGMYMGSVALQGKGINLKKAVHLQIYPVTVPKHGKLKTCWIYRNEGRNPQYYGKNWTRDKELAFIKQALAYRLDIEDLGSNAILPWDTVFSVDATGKVTANWDRWDKAFDTWRQAGKNTFLNYWLGWKGPKLKRQPEIEKQKLRLISQHLHQRNLQDLFYMYIFDEAGEGAAQTIRPISQTIHQQGQNLRLLFTMNYDVHQHYADYMDILVPHAEVYDLGWRDKLQAQNKEYWLYTCYQNFKETYPDNWRIDYYGTGHRALGWWLFKHKAQGYLYWAVDYWRRVNPWQDAETYPQGNGDGTMFYPAPDGKSLPYPSLRAELVRDGFEDYELLHMLSKHTAATSGTARKLLSADQIVHDLKTYNTHADKLLREKHRQLLGILSKADKGF